MKTRDLGNLVIVADNEDDLDRIENTIATLAKGCYQRDLARGKARWSGADLRGNARHWSSRYRASRDSLIDRIEREGYPTRFARGLHGLKYLVVGMHDAILAEYCAG